MKKLKLPLITLIFTAIIFLATYLTSTSTQSCYVSLGDSFIMLAACFLPTSYAFVAAGLGNGLASLLIGGPMMVLYVTIIRLLVACWFMDTGKRIVDGRNISGAGISAFLLIAGPILVNLLRFSSFSLAMPEILAAIINAIFFIVLAFVCDALKIRPKIFPTEKKS